MKSYVVAFALVALSMLAGPVCAKPQRAMRNDQSMQHPISSPYTGLVPYDIPAANNGSQLDSSAGLGEPLNVSLLQGFRSGNETQS